MYPVNCAVALMYQKEDGDKLIQKLKSCFVQYRPFDEERVLVSRAVKYFKNHPTFKEELEDFEVVMWEIVVGSV